MSRYLLIGFNKHIGGLLCHKDGGCALKCSCDIKRHLLTLHVQKQLDQSALPLLNPHCFTVLMKRCFSEWIQRNDGSWVAALDRFRGREKGFTRPLSPARFSRRCPGIHFTDLPIKILLVWHWGIAPPFHSSVRLKCTKHTLPFLKHRCLRTHCSNTTFIYVPSLLPDSAGEDGTTGNTRCKIT